MNEDTYELVENTANMLRGMTLDPAIPEHAKTAMLYKVNELEAALSVALEEMEG